MKIFNIIKKGCHTHSKTIFPETKCSNYCKNNNEEFTKIEKKIDFIIQQNHINRKISIVSLLISTTSFFKYLF